MQYWLGDVKLDNFVVRDGRGEPKVKDLSPAALEVFVIDLAGVTMVCCLLSVVCCLLSVVCCLLSVVCCLLSVVCCLLSDSACLLCVQHVQFPSPLTTVNARYYTEQYQAPEAKRLLTPTSDYYALGVSIKEMLDVFKLPVPVASDPTLATQLPPSQFEQLQRLAAALLSDDAVQQDDGVEAFLACADLSAETTALISIAG